jgi:hypothetical protein
MLIREYQPGDAKKIVSLLASNTVYLRDENYWLWINRIWPEQDSIIVVAEEDGILLAHYAILPIPIHIGGRIIPAGLGIHALVDPSARSKVPIFQITKRCYKIAKDRGIELLYGFPNRNFRLIQEKVEGWKCVRHFNALVKVAKPSNYTTLTLDNVRFDDPIARLRIHDLLEQTSDDSLFTTLPSYEGWIRRFALHPQTQYEFHIITKSGVDLGVIVSRIYKDVSGVSEAQIVEMIAPKDFEQREVIAAFENHCAKFTDNVCLWPLDKNFETAAISSGYSSIGFDTFFGIKVLDPKLSDEYPKITNYAAWRLPMAMSDVF